MNNAVNTLLLEKVQPSKVLELDTLYRIEFKTTSENVYTVFLEKKYVEEHNLDLNDYYDVIRVDYYRRPIEKDFVEDIFSSNYFLQYQGILSTIRIEPNHTDPAKFNKI